MNLYHNVAQIQSKRIELTNRYEQMLSDTGKKNLTAKESREFAPVILYNSMWSNLEKITGQAREQLQKEITGTVLIAHIIKQYFPEHQALYPQYTEYNQRLYGDKYKKSQPCAKRFMTKEMIAMVAHHSTSLVFHTQAELKTKGLIKIAANEKPKDYRANRKWAKIVVTLLNFNSLKQLTECKFRGVTSFLTLLGQAEPVVTQPKSYAEEVDWDPDIKQP